MADDETPETADFPDETFDEVWYLMAYPDVAAAVARGGWKIGADHWEAVGRRRGRFGCERHRARIHAARLGIIASPEPAEGSQTTIAQPSAAETVTPNGFDPAFYAAAYPLAREDVATGVARDFTDHYTRFGAARGYLTSRADVRADVRAGVRADVRAGDPAAMRSRFGGFWTDRADALDAIAGRRAIGWLDRAQAELLTKFVTDGFVVLPGAVTNDVLDRAEAALDHAFEGKPDALKFDINRIGDAVAWQPEARARTARLLDPHWQFGAIRDLIFAPGLLAFLHLITERPVFAIRSDGMLRGAGGDALRDSERFSVSRPMQLLGSCVAVETVSMEAGPLFLVPGSHRRPEATGPTPFSGRRGDVLVWAADLAHGGVAPTGPATLKSVVTRYTVAEAVPDYFERLGDRVRAAHGGAFHASANYAAPPGEV